MRVRIQVATLLALASSVAARGGGITFSVKPKVSAEGRKVRIEFAAATETDAAVAVVGPDGRVVRHLAAGMLGRKAPPPFRPGLAQVLHWDRRDDASRPAPEGCRVRVRLGLKPEYGGVLAWDGLAFGSIRSLAVGAKGVLYVLGTAPNGARITALSRDGKYLRTVLPYPAGLGADRLKGITLLRLTDGRTVPLVIGRSNGVYPHCLRIARQSMAVSRDGKILLIGDGGRLLRVRTDGSLPESFLGPRLWRTKRRGGYLACASDGEVLVTASVLGPAVFCLDPSGRSGPKPFARLEASKGKWEPRGLAVDAAGRVYVADPKGGRVLVFDAAGKLHRELPAKGAHQVAVHPATGAVYVLSQTPPQLVKLAGLSAEGPGALLARLEIPEIKDGRCVLAFDGSAAPPTLWLTPDGARLWRVEDAGGELKKSLEVRSKGLPFLSQITLDRTRDELYVKVSYDGRLERVDARTGEHKELPVFANDIYAGPDGYLYATRGSTYPRGYHPQFIKRYDREGRQVAFPGGLKTIRVETEKRSTRNSDSGRGLFVAPDGRLFVAGWDVYDYKGRKNRPGPVRVFAFSREGKLLDPKIVYGLPQGSSGVAADRAGNIYAGSAMKPSGKACPDYLSGSIVPTQAEREPWYMPSKDLSRHFAQGGCLLKFPPEGGSLWWKAERKMEQPPGIDAPDDYWRIREPKPKTFTREPVRVKGHAWCRFGVSPLLQGSGGTFGLPYGVHCVCRSMRLDLDGYGRVFVPDALAFCVRVFDAAGNELACIGSYGNPDSRGAKSPAPRPEIGTAGVRFLAASDEALYLSDEGNSRILRVRLAHRVEAEAPIP